MLRFIVTIGNVGLLIFFLWALAEIFRTTDSESWIAMLILALVPAFSLIFILGQDRRKTLLDLWLEKKRKELLRDIKKLDD